LLSTGLLERRVTRRVAASLIERMEELESTSPNSSSTAATTSPSSQSHSHIKMRLGGRAEHRIHGGNSVEDASNDDDDGKKGVLESVSIRASDRRNEPEIPLLLLSVLGVVQYIAHHRERIERELARLHQLRHQKMNQSPSHHHQQQVNDVKEGEKNKEEESKVAAAQEVEDEKEEDEDKEIGLPPVLRMALEHILRFGDHDV